MDAEASDTEAALITVRRPADLVVAVVARAELEPVIRAAIKCESLKDNDY